MGSEISLQHHWNWEEGQRPLSGMMTALAELGVGWTKAEEASLTAPKLLPILVRSSSAQREQQGCRSLLLLATSCLLHCLFGFGALHPSLTF